MSITLSDEQKVYIQTSGKVILNACPGSGKTTTVAHKLFSLIQNRENTFSASAGIVCLSFTNVAKNEIAEKFREISGFSLPYPHLISNIDKSKIEQVSRLVQNMSSDDLNNLVSMLSKNNKKNG